MENQKESKGLNIVVWVLQVLLAISFGMAGVMKISMPISELAEGGMSFVNSFSLEMVRFIGISEILGALGLIIPAAIRVKPFLSALAAIGIATIMVLATAYHLSSGEPFVTTIVLFVMAAFVAWARIKKVPISPK